MSTLGRLWTRLTRPSARDRFIFHYKDGGRKRSADPVEVERVLIARLGDDWYQKVASLSKPAPAGVVGADMAEVAANKEKTRAVVLAAINEAFDVKPYRDGVGLTEMHRFALLDGFVRFVIDLMELARPFATQSPRASPSPAG
jgi:hypothetical protein